MKDNFEAIGVETFEGHSSHKCNEQEICTSFLSFDLGVPCSTHRNLSFVLIQPSKGEQDFRRKSAEGVLIRTGCTPDRRLV